MKIFNFRILLTTLIIGFIFPAIAMMPREKSSGTVKRVVIDAGHGGRDAGNLGTGRYKKKEKDISLEVALMVGNYIKENLPDVEVIYTRNTDKFVELHERAAMANREQADLFISIHCNAHTAHAAYGTETFVMGLTREKANLDVAKRENSVIFLEDDYEEKYKGYDPNDPQSAIVAQISSNAYLDQSVKLAQLVQNEFTNRVKRHDRGVKQSVLYVLDFTAMPSVLIELGFLTNRSEEDFLNTQNGKELMASAIYRAFKQYKLEADELDKLNKDEEPDAENITNKPETAKPDAPALPKDNPTAKTDVKGGENAVESESDAVRYMIQIATSGQKLETIPANFNGLSGVSYYTDGKLYKYTFGSFSSVAEASKSLTEVRNKGFKDAFVIAFYKGERISLSKAAEINK